MARTVVGLDIGSSGIRAAEFTLGRRTTLRRLAAAELPEGTLRSGAVADPEALTEALRQLWSDGKFGSKEVVLGVANDSVLVRQMDLEWMPPADFAKALRYQVADTLPVPVDEANLDYYLLDDLEVPDAGGATRRVARVMLVAAGQEMVDGFVRPLQAAGLRPLRVDLLPFALVRAATPVGGADEPLEAVVALGAETVVVVVHQAGRPRFVRTVAGHGGHALTRRLMDRYGWEQEDAERTKVVLGLPGHARLDEVPGEQDTDRPALDLTGHPAYQVISESVDALVAELRATLTYFRSAGSTEQPLSRIVLTGSAARLGGLAEAIGEQLGLPVEHLDVLDRIRKPRRLKINTEDADYLAVTAGLCLGVPA